jgi:uncharacterized membrane protein YsdA (DUF1294 family)/cold shock CspA family protein
MRYTGKLTIWKDDKGFGFITPNRGGKEVFVHIRSFVNRKRKPVLNEKLTFELKKDSKGREQAETVLFQGERTPKKFSSPDNRSVFFDTSLPFVVAGSFMAFVALLTLMGVLSWVILAMYLATSAICFVAYAIDKSAARNDQWRTRESTLHFFSMIGGWPGALTAQKVLRHKSHKKSFQAVFITTVIINFGLLGWQFTPWGTAMLHSLLEAV